tara:strand:- start:31728 stop:32627 length:900 start_codon:yes stop_codon:yes gene_type:complete
MKNKPFKIYSGRITDRNSQSLSKYLTELAAIEPFTPDEEYECAIKARNGDKKATEELVKRNLRFVVSVAKAYVREGAPLGDLINEGNEGMTIAAQKFDPTTGYKFISYAIFWVRRNIMNYLGDHGQTIRVPNNRRDGISKLKRALSDIEQTLGRTATYMDLVDENTSDERIEELELLTQMAGLNVTSMDTPLDLDGSTGSMYELIADDTFGTTDKLVMDNNLSDILASVLDELSPLDRAVIGARYGLYGGARQTLKECSESPDIQSNGKNISRERVRQVETKALRILKGHLMKRASDLV